MGNFLSVELLQETADAWSALDCECSEITKTHERPIWLRMLFENNVDGGQNF